jgi:Hint domain-containing protein
MRRTIATVVLVALAVACGSSPQQPPGSPKPIPALKLAVLDTVGGRLAYCDPDLYPIARGSPLEAATERLPAIRRDTQAFAAILRHERIADGDRLTPAQIQAVNDLYKQMQAIDLVRRDDGYAFDILVPTGATIDQNQRIRGTVSIFGQVAIDQRGPGEPIACPICLVRGTMIATPTGQVRVEDVRAGMAVWSTDHSGRRVAAVVERTGSMRAPVGHEVVRIALADGRTLVASPGHPTADGRRIGGLRPGDALDGSRVASAQLLPYDGRTYDLRPSGPTGTYVANGILIGTTLP